VWSVDVATALLEAKFYVIGFEYMLEVVQSQDEVEYMPCEVGIVEWSMGKGISREFHSVINPGMLRHLSITNIQIVTDIQVTIENYFPVVGNIPRGRRTRGIFPTTGK